MEQGKHTTAQHKGDLEQAYQVTQSGNHEAATPGGAVMIILHQYA
jgi:hypothetical protein